MKFLSLSSLIFLTGCMSVPIQQKFPDVPEEITKPCVDLKKIKEEASLSEIAKTVTENYNLYYECSIKHEAFNEWYKSQKQIFESVK